MRRPALFEVCPADGCGRRLRWEFVEVHGGGDPAALLPDECFHYADCACGMSYTRCGVELREQSRPVQLELLTEAA